MSFIFSCPPYYNLETYSTDSRDLSCAQSFGDFCDAYRRIIAAAVRRLRDDHFACFVVGEIRNPETGLMQVHGYEISG